MCCIKLRKKWPTVYYFQTSPSLSRGRLSPLSFRIFLMNKQSIIEKVHGVLGGTKADAERAVDAMIESITDGLKKGDEVSIAGLGIFSTKMRPARQGRNPRTGETIKIAAMRVPKFRPAKALKDTVK